MTGARIADVFTEFVSEGWERVSVAVPGRPEYVRAARAFVLQALGEDHPCAATAAQLTSELVTNSLVHSRSGGDGGAVGIAVLMSPFSARVEVRDAGSRKVPRIISASPLGEGGRGLRLVAAMSDDWGTWKSENGRTTWFEIRRP
jgi:anti-sigma regulatory factor (Ser/Thr protein kinase)